MAPREALFLWPVRVVGLRCLNHQSLTSLFLAVSSCDPDFRRHIAMEPGEDGKRALLSAIHFIYCCNSLKECIITCIKIASKTG